MWKTHARPADCSASSNSVTSLCLSGCIIGSTLDHRHSNYHSHRRKSPRQVAKDSQWGNPSRKPSTQPRTQYFSLRSSFLRKKINLLKKGSIAWWLKIWALETTNLSPRPCSAIFQLCDFGPVTHPLWARFHHLYNGPMRAIVIIHQFLVPPPPAQPSQCTEGSPPGHLQLDGDTWPVLTNEMWADTGSCGPGVHSEKPTHPRCQSPSGTQPWAEMAEACWDHGVISRGVVTAARPNRSWLKHSSGLFLWWSNKMTEEVLNTTPCTVTNQ